MSAPQRSRRETWWANYRLPDPEHHRHGSGPRYFAVLQLDGADEGYARFRVKDEWKDGITASKLRVIEALATSPEAHPRAVAGSSSASIS